MRCSIPVASVLAVLLVPVAAAADEDLAWRFDSRDVTLAPTADGFQFTSSRDSPLGQDTMSGTFDAGAARLILRFEATRPESADLTLAARGRALVEFRDADGDGRYGLADPVVQSFDIPSLPHGTVLTPLLDGGQSAIVTYTLPENGSSRGPLPGPGSLAGPRGTLRLTVTMVPTAGNSASAPLRPTDVGLATEVRDFPFRAGDTGLALVSDLSAPGGLQARPDGAALEVGNLTLALAWPPLVASEGSAQDAGVAVVASEPGAATLVQSWPRAAAISQHGVVSAQHWRSAVAASLPHLPPGDWRFFSLGLAAAGVGLGLPSLRRLRER